uniref:Uncharacterized protein n=1 Tax=Zea mays TaxID=4577 RepID=C4J6H4_MAIZE|nr:unknown [Zea mays]
MAGCTVAYSASTSSGMPCSAHRAHTASSRECASCSSLSSSAVSAAGSDAVRWSGLESDSTGKECVFHGRLNDGCFFCQRSRSLAFSSSAIGQSAVILMHTLAEPGGSEAATSTAETNPAALRSQAWPSSASSIP